MSMMRSRILGTGRALPQKVLTNADLEKMVDTSDAWITERTGISERRILEDGRVTSDLATEAARSACQSAGIDPTELDCIILGTVTPDMPMPATAVYVQQKLGAKACAAFDVSAACAGFLYSMTLADALIRGGQFKRVLVIGVEILSRILDWKDRNTCVLFGDGAGAVVMGPEPIREPLREGDRPRGIMSTHVMADGAGAEALLIPGGGSRYPTSDQSVADNLHVVKMNGKTVFSHAVRNLSSSCIASLEANKLAASDVDLVIAHQANIRILEGVGQRLGVPMEKFHMNLHKYGNTSSASLPIALDEAVREGKLKEGMIVLFCAMGAGFSWGSAVVRW